MHIVALIWTDPHVVRDRVVGEDVKSDRVHAPRRGLLLGQQHGLLSVTAAVDGEYQSGCSQVDAQRWYCISYSTWLREIKNFNQANEQELPPDQEIVAYCRGPWCVLSFEAVALLRNRGYQARRLEDGYPEWKTAGLPIDSPP